jgi:hypothetical protein
MSVLTFTEVFFCRCCCQPYTLAALCSQAIVQLEVLGKLKNFSDIMWTQTFWLAT